MHGQCNSDLRLPFHQTWNWVSGSFHSFGSSFTSGLSFWPGVRSKFFRFSKKCPKCKTYIWNALLSVVGLKSLDVSPCNELLLLPMIIKNSLAWEYFFTHKSTFGVYYRTGSPGQLGLRVAGFPGHWVAGSQNVTQFHLCFPPIWHHLPVLLYTVWRWRQNSQESTPPVTFISWVSFQCYYLYVV